MGDSERQKKNESGAGRQDGLSHGFSFIAATRPRA
jgi:hypothetical protein